ncbi:peptidylprolyl isomerase [Luteimicrobium album]|uniref:peptidylprolyl isomerase n=1 Tax=Luteimicrobium album TaxID=1054550 RepID=A0ABQ6I429_9MICO|nr:FKBP-type peptidyl-prolyl cis-trans isomerase [Luteimicrobium album]GMA25237.1 peptidylprolyl isomerase [Luteimicrobium album]
MKNRTVLRARSVTGLAAVVALAGSLALAGCSSDSDGGSSSTPSGTSTTAAASDTATASAADVAALKEVTVKGDVGKKPTVTVPKNFSVTGAVARVDTPGTGATIKEGEVVLLNSIALQGDGTALGDTYSGKPQAMYFDKTTIVPQLAAALDGQKAGARIVYAAPSQDSSGNPTTYVYSLDVASVKEVGTRAEGTAVKPKSGLPTVKVDSKTGEPSITIAKGYKAPSKVTAQTLIKGDGAKVKATDTVIAQYSGWTMDGKSFDSSWSRGAKPATFSLAGGVIEGWTTGLTGQTVGSQVLLVIPADKAYGANPPEGSNIPKNAPLAFVVDILDAEPGA